MASEAALLLMQAPNGLPRSTFFETVSDPLLPPYKTTEMLAHFYEDIYDLTPESHLSRLLKVVLGDTGTGQLRKRYTYAHLSEFLLTTHYNDLDQLYASVFGLKRFLRERLVIFNQLDPNKPRAFDPYLDAATDEEWEAITTADASYRNRIEAFSHSLLLAGTPDGMRTAAHAILGEEVRIYETYSFIDDADVYAPVKRGEINTYGDLEASRYTDLEDRTYAQLEGSSYFEGRLPSGRGEFIVRPLRTVSNEERYHLTKVLGRIKPAEALMTIDARPAALHVPVPVHRAVATSSYWHVKSRVQVDQPDIHLYDRSDGNTPVEQPRPAFSAYQGEAWSYNADVIAVTAYVEDEDGTLIQDSNFYRDSDTDGGYVDYRPEQALTDPKSILMGRSVSDGVLSAPVAERGGE